MKGKAELLQFPIEKFYWNTIPVTLHDCPKNGVCVIAIALYLSEFLL
jgi:hypothetical protein